MLQQRTYRSLQVLILQYVALQSPNLEQIHYNRFLNIDWPVSRISSFGLVQIGNSGNENGRE